MILSDKIVTNFGVVKRGHGAEVNLKSLV